MRGVAETYVSVKPADATLNLEAVCGDGIVFDESVCFDLG